MRITISTAASLALLLYADAVFACAHGFGAELEIEPEQTLVIAHADGVETYVFQAAFCGAAEDFGLILPIPGSLVEDPTLGEDRLYDELDDLTQPRVEIQEVCEGDADGGATGAAPGGAMGGPDGVSVISAGSVGIFDWVQLDADSAAAFTDWLDERSFPYDEEAMDAFEHYVGAGWKFVAFAVDPAEAAGVAGSMEPGTQICGEFGPIQLAFEAEEPVLPLRMAANDGDSLDQTFTWRVFAIAAEKLAAAGIETYRDEPSSGTGSGGATSGAGGGDAGFIQAEERYAGMLDADVLGRSPTLAAVAGEGDWVTEIELTFDGRGADDDLRLERAAEQEEFQRVIYDTEYVDCSSGDRPGSTAGGAEGGGGGGGGCAMAGPGAHPGGWLVILALAVVRRRRATRRRVPTRRL